MGRKQYSPDYSGSHALLIGINTYQNLAPLSYAVNDVNAVAAVLENTLGFEKECIHILINEDATRDAIMRSYLSYVDATSVGENDRIFIFFAGHGHTVPGSRGDTGFLVPVDGELDDLSTLIRWDELTRNSELVRAKHMFFVMDACYGGLALQRSPIPAGSLRLLDSMRQRFARQVLTAGKGDEPVADGNGTRPGNSIFTAHLLDALEGMGTSTEGVITANGVMSYVYEKVGSDPLSKQTPDYGAIEGDGNFIFLPYQREKSKEQAVSEEQLVQIPPSPPDEIKTTTAELVDESFEEKIKQFLPNPTQQIRLDDLLSNQLRNTVQSISLDRFPVTGISFTKEEFEQRLRLYEENVFDLSTAMMAIVRWGNEVQALEIETMIRRLAETDKGQSGLKLWMDMGWYPLVFLLYVVGITAISRKKYGILKQLLLTPISVERLGGKQQPLVVLAMTAVANLHDGFKTLPGLENRYTPRSDYMYEKLQPLLEDRLFLGKHYETLFDEFESLVAVAFADAVRDTSFGTWGPPGRFMWKMNRGYGDSVYVNLITEAEKEKENWEVLKGGLFGGSSERFLISAKALQKVISERGWF